MEEKLKYWRQEVKNLSQLKHCYVLRYVEHFNEKDNYYVVTNYIKGQSLKAVLKSGKVDQQFAYKTILQILIAMRYVH